MHRCQLHLPDVELANIHTIDDIRALSKVAHRTPVIQHPVAFWFQECQKANQLPLNVSFIPYVKEKRRELRKMY
jgi:hypothetical protein